MILALTLASIVLGKTSGPVAKASPGPARTQKAFTWSGSLRAYYFARTNGNTCLTSQCSPKGTPDSQAFNAGVRLHGEYSFAPVAFSVGATYYGSTPFGANAFGLLGVGYNPQVDNTLPGYAISTLAEMYAEYKSAGLRIRSGKQVLNTPWANPADSRIVPETYQGTVVDANVSRNFSLGAMYIARFKSRVTSAFNSNTLLTSCNTAQPTGKGPIAGVSGTFTVEGDQCNTQQTTDGFLLFSASYKANGVAARAYQYHIYDLVDLTYVDAALNYAQNSFANPSVAVQYWSNNDIGRALVGRVHSHGYGFQFGRTIVRNVELTFAYNDQPIASYVVPANQCPGTAASPTGPGAGRIFGGVQDTSAKGLPAGQVLCYAGGTASPYTDAYESDPLYTSSIGEGIIDARKGGSAVKLSLAAQTENRRLKALLTQARYNVSLPGTSDSAPNKDIRTESNIDVQYFFNPVTAHVPYHGLSLRQRLVYRSQTYTPFQFTYSRTQLEFDF